MALTTTAAQMVAAARARITEVETDELIAQLRDPNLAHDLVIVDIRDIRERQRSGFIPGSIHAPRGMLEFWIDPASPYHKPALTDAKRLVLFCASAWRSALSTKTLQDMGVDAVAELEGGFSGWRDAGYPVDRDG